MQQLTDTLTLLSSKIITTLLRTTASILHAPLSLWSHAIFEFVNEGRIEKMSFLKLINALSKYRKAHRCARITTIWITHLSTNGQNTFWFYMVNAVILGYRVFCRIPPSRYQNILPSKQCATSLTLQICDQASSIVFPQIIRNILGRQNLTTLKAHKSAEGCSDQWLHNGRSTQSMAHYTISQQRTHHTTKSNLLARARGK